MANKYRAISISAILCVVGFAAPASSLAGTPYLSHLHATKDSPLYTTYAAALQRSEFILDVGYHFEFYDTSRALCFRNQKGGDWGVAFADVRDGKPQRFVWKLSAVNTQPVITTSYTDIVKYHYSPLEGLQASSTFFVYSSSVAVQEMTITNTTGREREIEVVPLLASHQGLYHSIKTDERHHALEFNYIDLPDGWTIGEKIPHVDTVFNVFAASFKPDSIASFRTSLPWRSAVSSGDSAYSLGLFKTFNLKPGKTVTFRIARIVGRSPSEINTMLSKARKAFGLGFNSFVKADQRLYSRIPIIRFSSSDQEMMYWSAFTLMRQCMLPPEGRSKYNYYVFSREPVWGWGHGGQVFHESLSMLAYVFMDPQSAMNSQRVFMQRQHPDGYIDYRIGSYLDETDPYNGQLTTSAPWFNWENWEIYLVSKDKKFLRQAYSSGSRFFDFWKTHRDTQHDGLFEWGGMAVLESIRDADVAVWDQVGWPANFEGPDLNSMLAVSARSLSKMAGVLGKKEAARKWEAESKRLSTLVNKYMWDGSTDFYYNVNKLNHTFTFKKHDDLKRQEIIGFLPLWAGIASKEQARKLVGVMTDTAKFWRKYGVPSLAADDPYYNPRGYWNGPVWVEWNYLLERGLLRYGYRNVAKELVNRVTSNVIAQLKKDHYFWEFYDPDRQWAGYHRTYIWAGLVSRMLMDLNK